MERLRRLLCSSWMDKLVALSFVAYNLYLTKNWVGRADKFDLFLATITVPVHNIMLLVRRPAKDFTTVWWHWIIGLAAANWGMVWTLLPAVPRSQVIPQVVFRSVIVLGTLYGLWAKLSIGRSFGVLPANRSIVTTGAYAWVRHPIYAASFLTGLGYLCGYFSTLGLAMFVAGQILTYTKALIEEDFLSRDFTYQSYCQHVRWRIFPGIF